MEEMQLPEEALLLSPQQALQLALPPAPVALLAPTQAALSQAGKCCWSKCPPSRTAGRRSRRCSPSTAAAAVGEAEAATANESQSLSVWLSMIATLNR